MNDDKKKQVIIYMLMLVATLIVTCVLMLNFTDPSRRTNKFWLNLGSILFAESMTFGYFIVMSIVRNKSFHTLLPIHLATGIIIVIYDILILLTAVMSVFHLSYSNLLMVHLILILLLMLGIGSQSIAGIFIKGVARTQADSYAFMNEFKNNFSDLLNRLKLIQVPEMQQVTSLLNEFNEELKYCNRQSTPKSERADIELSQCLDEISSDVSVFERTLSGNPGARKNGVGETNVDESVEKLIFKAKRMRLILERREEIVKQMI